MMLKEFTDFYDTKGYLPNDVGHRKNKLNDKQLLTRYKKYMKSNAINEYTIDIRWNELKENLDLTECSLLKRLKAENMYDEISELKSNARGFINTIDPAHVFSRSSCPHMKYDLDNVTPLNRYSHSCIDMMRDPISGESITKEKQKLFWMFIVGAIEYESLEERSLNKTKKE